MEGSDPRAMTHSWLFTGPPGSGRSTTALYFAAAIMCPVEPGLGCGNCESCVGIIKHGRHTDLVFIEPQELSISVDSVRNVVESAARRPTVAPWRVIIFDNADRLSNSAANALLKTVEEPTASTVMIMCAPSDDPQDFSQTLRSRCRHLYIPTPTVDDIVAQLVSEGFAEKDSRLAAVTSLRHIGRARKLVSTPEIQQRRAMSINLAEDIFCGSGGFAAVGRLVKNVEKMAKESHKEADAAEVDKLRVAFGAGGRGRGTAKAKDGMETAVKELEKKQKTRGTRRVRDQLDLVLVDLAGIYRDALMLKVGAQVELVHPDFAGLSGELAAKVTEDGLLACQDAIHTCRLRIEQNVSPAIAFDGLVGRLRLACGTG
ncbi:DNA polymerase III subunit delta' [Corynebacterium phocae]|uniref:DNA polymerase III subunit delta n=1 Tax=Corynebacterium phocae TaxID=161895 RepID=A0A1L7D5Z1_9CORY|nr:DNA polymerase III subunit delta' [Corynebacterium phocae]